MNLYRFGAVQKIGLEQKEWTLKILPLPKKSSLCSFKKQPKIGRKSLSPIGTDRLCSCPFKGR